MDELPNIIVSDLSKDGVVELRLHSGQKSLIMNRLFEAQLADTISSLAKDRCIKAIILTGTGDDFISRAIKPCSTLATPKYYEELFADHLRLISALSRFSLPKIAALNGTVAPGADFLILFDVVLAVGSATFAEKPRLSGGVFLGIEAPLDPTIAIVPKSDDTLLYSEPLTPHSLMSWGLINEIVSVDNLMPRARELASALAGVSFPD